MEITRNIYCRNNKEPLVLPAGMTIEQKTEFLTNLDKKHQFFVSMPHMNAGKYNDDDFYSSSGNIKSSVGRIGI